MERILSPRAYFAETLPEKARTHPERLGGFRGSFVMIIQGPEGGEWTASVDEAGLTVKEGATVDPVFSVTMQTDNFLRLSNREIHPAVAFLMGKVRLRGSIAQAMKLQSLLF